MHLHTSIFLEALRLRSGQSLADAGGIEREKRETRVHFAWIAWELPSTVTKDSSKSRANST
jgi:hypothetical protein